MIWNGFIRCPIIIRRYYGIVSMQARINHLKRQAAPFYLLCVPHNKRCIILEPWIVYYLHVIF